MIVPRKLLFVILFAFVAVSFSSANTYFVTQSGAGNQDGTSAASAWSVPTFNGSTKPTGGDTVTFSGTISSTVSPKASGTGNGANRLTLDFTNATLTPLALQFNGNAYITALGGQVKGGSDGSSIVACSLPLTASHDITIGPGFTFTGVTGGSDLFMQVGGCSNLTVVGNTMDNIGSCVNSYQGSQHDITILNNFCRTSVNVSGQTDVINLGDVINVTIQGNKLVNQAPGSASNSRHNDVIQAYRGGGSQSQNPSNWVIRYNWIEVAQKDGSGGNMSWDELENFAGQPALKIYGNVYVGTGGSWNGGNGLSLHSGTNASDTYYVYNNTFWAHQDPINPVRLGEGDGPGTLFFRNNVVGTDNGQNLQITFSAGAPWNHNDFFGVGNCSSTYSGPNGACSLSLGALVSAVANDFAAVTGSPLVNVGDSTLGSEFNQGIANGATWPNPTLVTRTAGAWDVGAYQGGNPSAPPTQGQKPVPPVGLSASVT